MKHILAIMLAFCTLNAASQVMLKDTSFYSKLRLKFDQRYTQIGGGGVNYARLGGDATGSPDTIGTKDAQPVRFISNAGVMMELNLATGQVTLPYKAVFTASATASNPVIEGTGSPFAGTTATSLPLFYLHNKTGGTWSALGAWIGGDQTGTNDWLNFLTAGTSVFRVLSSGNLQNAGTITSSGTVSGSNITASNGNVTITATTSLLQWTNRGRQSIALNGSDTTLTLRGASGVVPMSVDMRNGILSGYIDLTQIAAPTNPSSGTIRLYVDQADGRLKAKNSAGTVTNLTP